MGGEGNAEHPRGSGVPTGQADGPYGTGSPSPYGSPYEPNYVTAAPPTIHSLDPSINHLGGTGEPGPYCHHPTAPYGGPPGPYGSHPGFGGGPPAGSYPSSSDPYGAKPSKSKKDELGTSGYSRPTTDPYGAQPGYNASAPPYHAAGGYSPQPSHATNALGGYSPALYGAQPAGFHREGYLPVEYPPHHPNDPHAIHGSHAPHGYDVNAVATGVAGLGIAGHSSGMPGKHDQTGAPPVYGSQPGYGYASQSYSPSGYPPQAPSYGAPPAPYHAASAVPYTPAGYPVAYGSQGSSHGQYEVHHEKDKKHKKGKKDKEGKEGKKDKKNKEGKMGNDKEHKKGKEGKYK